MSNLVVRKVKESIGVLALLSALALAVIKNPQGFDIDLCREDLEDDQPLPSYLWSQGGDA